MKDLKWGDWCHECMMRSSDLSCPHGLLDDGTVKKNAPVVCGIVKRLGLGQRLVKARRLSTFKAELRELNYAEVSTGLYIEPHLGIFYARVPEVDDGTLYAASTLRVLRDEVRQALEERAIAALDAKLGDRIWKRRLRLVYGPERFVTVSIGEGKPEGMPRYGLTTQTPAAAVACAVPSALTFTRYERAPNPDRQLYDTREWEEDFAVRQRVYANMDKKERDSYLNKRPTRWHGREWMQRTSCDPVTSRDLPYSDELWIQLTDFANRISGLDATLRGFLLTLSTDAFLASMADGPRLLTATKEEA